MSSYTANQPLLGPHIYMMNRYANCEHYVSMNNAQFTKFGHQSRVELLDKHGNKQLLIIPLKNRSFAPLNEVQIDRPAYVLSNMAKTLKTLYGSREGYKQVQESLEHMLANAPVHDGITLAEFDNHILKWLFELVDLPIEWHDSEVIVPIRSEHPSEWVAQMGAAINCTEYLGGGTAQAAYLREEDFTSRGMHFVSQNYKMPAYTRAKGQWQTEATVSCLDPLFVGGIPLLQDLINRSAY